MDEIMKQAKFSIFALQLLRRVDGYLWICGQMSTFV
jgi:hypothetical protein